MSSDQPEPPAQAAHLAKAVIEPIQAWLPSFGDALSDLAN